MNNHLSPSVRRSSTHWFLLMTVMSGIGCSSILGIEELAATPTGGQQRRPPGAAAMRGVPQAGGVAEPRAFLAQLRG